MAVEKTIKIQLDARKAVTELKKLRSETDSTYADLRRTIPVDIDTTNAKKQIKEVNTDVQGAANSTKDIGKAAEGSVFGFEKLKFSTQAFGVALKATGIGLIVAAFVKLGQALSKNQVFMDNFNAATETISITFQQFVNKLVEATQTAVKFFSKVGGVIKKFLKKDVDGITSSYEAAGDATESLFQKNRRLAQEMVNLRNEVKLAEAEQRKLQLTYQRDAELQRQVRDDISKTIEERIQANTRLGQILDKQFKDEEAIAQKRIKLAELELSKNKENIDLKIAVTNAETELIDLQERITGQRSEQLINLTALENEYKESVKQTPITLAETSVEQLAITDDLNSQMLMGAKQTQDGLKSIEKKEAKDSLQILKAKVDADKALRVGAAKDILGSVAKLAGEGTAAAKAAALAGILIDTAKGVSGAISAGAGLPFPLNLGAIATGVASVLGGIVNAKAVLKKVPGGGGGGDTSVSVPTDSGGSSAPVGGIGPQVPNIQAVGSNVAGEEFGGATQAYVVESDISNAQALQNELDLQATL